jgi:hypothetical protein
MFLKALVIVACILGFGLFIGHGAADAVQNSQVVKLLKGGR